MADYEPEDYNLEKDSLTWVLTLLWSIPNIKVLKIVGGRL